jgi:hypothetical protein
MCDSVRLLFFSSSLNKRPCFEGFIEVNNTGELPCRVSCGLACGVKYEEVNTEKRGETSQVFSEFTPQHVTDNTRV